MSYALVMQILYFSHVSLEVDSEFVLFQMHVCSLLVSCVADKWEPELKAIFSYMKNTLFGTQFSPQNAGNRISGL